LHDAVLHRDDEHDGRAPGADDPTQQTVVALLARLQSTVDGMLAAVRVGNADGRRRLHEQGGGDERRNHVGGLSRSNS